MGLRNYSFYIPLFKVNEGEHRDQNALKTELLQFSDSSFCLPLHTVPISYNCAGMPHRSNTMFALTNRLSKCINMLIRTVNIPNILLAGFLVELLGTGIITLIIMNVHSAQIPVTLTATKTD